MTPLFTLQSYETGFGQAVEELRQAQQQQGELFTRELSKKMFKPKPSREYLNLKKMEVRMSGLRPFGWGIIHTEIVIDCIQTVWSVLWVEHPLINNMWPPKSVCLPKSVQEQSKSGRLTVLSPIRYSLSLSWHTGEPMQSQGVHESSADEAGCRISDARTGVNTLSKLIGLHPFRMVSAVYSDLITIWMGLLC